MNVFIFAIEYIKTETTEQRLMFFTDGRYYSRVYIFYFHRRGFSVYYQICETRGS